MLDSIYLITPEVFLALRHIEIMNTLRQYYRNIFVETVLLIAVLVQIISGLKLFKTNRKTATSQFDKLHIWSGLYLAIFFVINLSGLALELTLALWGLKNLNKYQGKKHGLLPQQKTPVCDNSKLLTND